MAGGTAVAIHLGHRRSVDFDWFTPDPIPDPLALARIVSDAGVPLEVASTAPDTLHARVESVQVTLLAYRYPLLRAPETWTEYACAIASEEDLACMKLSAIAQRGARRDFVDVDALLTASGRDLGTLFDSYRRKFGVGDTGHLLAALAYFDDAEKEPPVETAAYLDWEGLKARMRSRVKAAAAGSA